MAESGYTIVQLRRIAAVALALLCLMAPAWAEEAEISSMPAEAQVEETQTFELGGDAWQDPAWTADVESRTEEGSQGPAYVPVSRLSPNFAESMRMMSEIQRIRATLPGIDCGACGAPTCRAHAEDAVRAGKRTVSCPFADTIGGNR